METPDERAAGDQQRQEASKHQAADLLAQQKAADAATASANADGSAVFWAAASAFATAIAALLAFLAWLSSNRALKVAIQAQRAHLMCEAVFAGNFFGIPPKNPGFGYTLVNRGQTPAWIVSGGIGVIIGELPESPPDVPCVGIRTVPIAPGKGESYTEALDFTNRFTNWEEDLYVIGWVRYRDVFATRETHFLFKFDPHEFKDMDKMLVPWGGASYWRYT